MRILLILNELILYFDFNLLEIVYKNFDMKRWKKNIYFICVVDKEYEEVYFFIY